MDFPFGYERIAPTTWAYLSSLLMLALFFKFNRFWSVRNFDLILIILLAPGLLFIQLGELEVAKHKAEQRVQLAIKQTTQSNGELPDSIASNLASDQLNDLANNDDSDNGELKAQLVSEPEPLNTTGHQRMRYGFYWLFSVGALLLIRLLIDPSLSRRPLLEPNLTMGGMIFFGVSLLMFLLANIATVQVTDDDLTEAENAVKLIQREAAQSGDRDELRRRGPGYRLFNLLPIIPSFESGAEIMETDPDRQNNMSRYIVAAKSLAILSQLLVVTGMFVFCYVVYDSLEVGFGVATIYLMLPYTAMYTGHVLHALPAGLLVWALVSFRRPMAAGLLVGMAIGVTYYPIFLLPLWASFYWERGVKRFVIGVLVSVAICAGGLVFSSVTTADFVSQLQEMFGFWRPLMDGLEGIWALGWNQWWRLPLLVAFVLLCVSFVFWPAEKNIGTLVSYTGAIMVAVQFWHGFGGGTFVAWYIPMVLIIIFRPNLKGRVALEELREETRRKRKPSADDLLPTS